MEEFYKKSFDLFQDTLLKMQCLAIGGAVTLSKEENQLAKNIMNEADQLTRRLKSLLNECSPAESKEAEK